MAEDPLHRNSRAAGTAFMQEILKKNPGYNKMNSQNSGLSRKAEDYLEAILNVSLEKGYAKTRDIANELGVSPPSVVEMFIKLDRLKMIEYRKYEGVILKPKGREIASVIKYRHDTLMKFLKLISVPDKIANDDACLMEHELNPKTIEQIHLFIDFLEERGSDTHTLEDFADFCAVKRAAEKTLNSL